MELIAFAYAFVRNAKISGTVAAFSLLFQLIQAGDVAYARETKHPDDKILRAQLFSTKFLNFANSQRDAHKNPLPANVYYSSEIMTDVIAQDIIDHNFSRPLFRDDLADQALDVLIREKGKYPILIGEPGAGKTATTELMVYKILARDYPETSAYRQAFYDAVVLRVSARLFIPGGTDLNSYMNTVQFISKSLNRKIIVQMFESQFLNDYNVGVLRELADKRDGGVPVVLETDSKSYGNTIKNHPSFNSISRAIMVPQTSTAETRAIIKEQLLPRLNAELDVTLDDDILETILDLAKDYGRDSADPRRSLYLTEEFAIDWNRRGATGTQPTRFDLYKFVAREARFPVIPQNEKEFSEYMESLRERVKKRVVAQDTIVDGLIDQFRTALTSRIRQHSVAMIMGPTGVGKTLSAEVLAEEFYGDRDRVLELDMTQFGDATGLNTLFGASNGYISSDKEKGVVCEFLDGPGKGGGVLILNEIEEAHGEVFTRFMELFDKGVVRCGDGRLRHLGRSLIVMTSNKNTDRILSYDAIRGMSTQELDRRLSQITQDQLKKAFSEKASYTQSDSKVVKSAVLERVDQFYFASPLLQENAVAVSNLEINKFVGAYNRQSKSVLEVDPSFGFVLTSAFYNESLGARQIRTAVQQSISNSVQDFKKQFGYDSSRLVISAKLHPSRKTSSFITVTDPDTGQEITNDGPRVPVVNKMLDPEFRQRLVDFEANLKTEVFGQDETIAAMASAIKARFLRGGKGDVVAGFLIGATGAGKSQLGKSSSKALYGRAEAFVLIEMGKVQNALDMYNIFSPPKGIIGSDAPGLVEQFLIQYPDGGTLIFDEMSNAGGGNPEIKAAIAKQFYTMIEEGIYRNPAGKVYDLSNHLLIMTGNDGEEIFKGLSSDSLLEQQYQEATKNPELVKELLRKAGFTDAFLGRLSFAQLMRPTLGDIKIMIARKMLNQWRKEVEAQQPFDIQYDEDFVKQIGHLMYSPKSGARSISHFISSTMGKAVANEALKFNWEELLEKGQRGQITLSLAVDKVDTPFYAGKEPYKNKAEIYVTASHNGQIVSAATVDFSGSANFVPQVHREIAEATAYHEMGHLVAAFTEITGKKVIKLTIVPEKIGPDLNALGYAQHKKVPSKVEPNRDYLLANLAGLLAGSETEILFGKARTTGRSNDVERIGNLARSIILENHLVPELDAAHAYVGKDGSIVGNLPPGLRKTFDSYVAAAIADARKLAQKTIKENWHVIVAGAELLLEHHNLSEKTIERLLERGESMKKSPTLKQRALALVGYSDKVPFVMDTTGIFRTPEEEKADCEKDLSREQ